MSPIQRGYSIRGERGWTSRHAETPGEYARVWSNAREEERENEISRRGRKTQSKRSARKRMRRELEDTRNVPLRTEDYHRISCSVMTGQKSGEKEHFLGDAFLHVKEGINSPVLAPSVITLRLILANVRLLRATGLPRAIIRSNIPCAWRN